jgi:hypothetical protein
MGWPKKFAISCQPFNRSVQSSVLPLRITQITPISRLALPQSSRYPRIPRTIWIKKALFPTV